MIYLVIVHLFWYYSLYFKIYWCIGSVIVGLCFVIILLFSTLSGGDLRTRHSVFLGIIMLIICLLYACLLLAKYGYKYLHEHNMCKVNTYLSYTMLIGSFCSISALLQDVHFCVNSPAKDVNQADSTRYNWTFFRNILLQLSIFAIAIAIPAGVYSYDASLDDTDYEFCFRSLIELNHSNIDYTVFFLLFIMIYIIYLVVEISNGLVKDGLIIDTKPVADQTYFYQDIKRLVSLKVYWSHF